jgi:hypothetical protein
MKSVQWESRCSMRTDGHDEAKSLFAILRTRLKMGEACEPYKRQCFLGNRGGHWIEKCFQLVIKMITDILNKSTFNIPSYRSYNRVIC